MSTAPATGAIEAQTKEARIMEILGQAKKLAQEYRALTGKPVGITGEVAEYEAARLLKIELAEALHAGYDAREHVKGRPRRLQIKGRCMLPGCKPGQRLGRTTSRRSLTRS